MRVFISPWYLATLSLVISSVWAGYFTPLRVRVSRAVVGEPCNVTLEYVASAHPVLNYKATIPSEKLIAAKGAPGMQVSDMFHNGNGTLRLSIDKVTIEQLKWGSPFQILAKFIGDNYYWKITFKFRGSADERILPIPNISYNKRPPKEMKFHKGEHFEVKCGMDVKGSYDYAGTIWNKKNDLQFSNATYQVKKVNRNYDYVTKKVEGGVRIVGTEKIDDPTTKDQGLWECTNAVKMYYVTGVRGSEMVYLLVHIISTTDVSLETDTPSSGQPVFATPIPQLKVWPDFMRSPSYPRGVLDTHGPRFQKPWFLQFYCTAYGAPDVRLYLYRNDELITRRTAPNIHQVSLKTSAFTDHVLYTADCTDLSSCQGEFRCEATNGDGYFRSTQTWVIKE